MTDPSFDASFVRQRKRRIHGILIVLLAFAITSGALVANVALLHVAEKGRRAEVLLLQLHGFAYRLSALEWKAIGERKMSPETARRVQDTQDDMIRSIGSLEQLDRNAEALRLLRLSYDAYVLAINEEFKLIKAGDLAQAQVIDDDLVDPAFDALVQVLTSTGANYGAKAKRLEQLALLGSMAVLLFAVAAIAVLVWRIQEAQTAAEKAVTEQRVLTRTQEELRQFADNVPAMTASWDENLCCRFANKAFAEFFGFTPENMIGKHLREIVEKGVYPEIEGHFAQALAGHPVTYRRTRKLANGQCVYLEVRLLPHSDDQGKVLGCFLATTDITEHILAEDRIRRTAHHDSLTGLPNRLLFNDRLDQAISLAKRDSRQFALLYLDLDRFKRVNDTLGHAAGDELLQAVAARIRGEVRESDTVARIGGDEFAVILPNTARREEAETVARKIITALVAPFQLGAQGSSIDIGASIGIALYPEDGANADTLITAADSAMYSAKEVGSSFRLFKA